MEDKAKVSSALLVFHFVSATKKIAKHQLKLLCRGRLVGCDPPILCLQIRKDYHPVPAAQLLQYNKADCHLRFSPKLRGSATDY
jgi:hypothetical protein